MFVSKKKYKYLKKKYDELVETSLMPSVEKIELFKNNIEVNFGPAKEALHAWAQIFTKAFIDMGAQNYIEVMLGVGKDKYVFTIRKFFGKTPHALREEAEKKVKALEEEIRKLKGEKGQLPLD